MTTRTASALARAKINLTFEILRLLPSGYHEVKTLMQAVDLYDKVRLDVTELSEGIENKISMRGYVSNLTGDFPMDKSNLAVKAASAYLERIDSRSRFDIQIDVEKSIPIQAGLAGGSADAAAVLVAMNGVFKSQLSQKELLDMASGLGADVPFCLTGGLATGEGVGDLLTSHDIATNLYLILVKPRALSISTPFLYKTYDKRKSKSTKSASSSKTDSALQALIDGTLDRFYGALSNDFESVFFELHPEMLKLKDKMLELGCWTVNLTGSGPTMYGTCPDLEKANLVQRMLIADKMNNPEKPYFKHGSLDTFVVKSSSDSAIILAQ